MLGTIAQVGLGLILVLFGATLSLYGVALLGGLIGGLSGYAFAPTIGDFIGLEGLVLEVVAALGGALVGIVIAYAVLSIAVAILSFLVGTLFAATTIVPNYLDASFIVELGAIIAIGVIAGLLALIFKRTLLMLVTALVGAALASLSVTIDDLQAAQTDLTIEPLAFEVASPLFLGLVILGILSQLGLFKISSVASFIASLPGSDEIEDRSGGAR